MYIKHMAIFVEKNMSMQVQKRDSKVVYQIVTSSYLRLKEMGLEDFHFLFHILLNS